MTGLPSSMAALGDSITIGFGSCFALVACERDSWATGASTLVDSHYLRIRAGNPKIRGHAYNFAVTGAPAAALARQADRAVRVKAGYVTILIGANDACADQVTDMTPVATFRGQIDAALAKLKKGLPKARILMVSIPDIYRLWELGHGNARAVRAWTRRGVCPSMLAGATSTAAADDRRRHEVADRVDAYDSELAKACDGYGLRCQWDGGKAHRVQFSLDLVNQIDYFHPDVQGQAKIADVTFPGLINW